ncbi:MAG TPA: right-handed parallel beta-helix repeat-containing protein [Arthrobacter sp.]|nr:right-handed parallel beta-helix repeat-containing protein [Arthrobacter sp.]
MRPENSTHPTAFDRRSVLLGAGTAGVGALASLATAPQASAATSGGLPVLAPGDDWALTLAATPQVQLVPGATYTISASVTLPSGTLIEGNGATVTVSSDGVTAFTSTATTGVTIRSLSFQGRASDPIGTAPNFGHVAIKLDRCTGYRVSDCSFTFWRGAGVVVTGNSADDYFSYRGHLEGNTFNRCYFGVSLADRSEYCMLVNNTFSANRLAIWNSSGNWTVVGNIVVNCYGAYYSYAKSSPYGALTADNWNHGAVIGNTFNHSNGSGGTRWTANAAFPIGGTTVDPGAGVVVDGLLPPTFTGNTLWYTNVTANNHTANQWMLTGCALSNLSITASGTNPIKLLGQQSNSAPGAVPVLVGNVVVIA